MLRGNKAGANMPSIRIGILGAARIAPKAVIAPAAANPEFEVTAVAARAPDRARSFAAANRIAHVADDYAALIARDDVDLVYVALPPAAHAAWTIAALQAGKAVLCEKPFALNAAEAERMTAVATATGRPLFEAFHYRFHKAMRRAVAIARSGELGRLRDAEATFDVAIARTPTELRWLPEQGGGALMDLGCYCLHALRSLAGSEPQIVAAQCSIVHGVDESTTAQLAFPSGLTARLSTAMGKDAPLRVSLRLTGETGALTLAPFVFPHDNGRLTVTVEGKTREEIADGPTTYQAQLAHIGDVLLRGAAPLTGGADAVANMAAIDAIYAAAGYVRNENAVQKSANGFP
jgi:predicted dehydrogenase